MRTVLQTELRSSGLRIACCIRGQTVGSRGADEVLLLLLLRAVAPTRVRSAASGKRTVSCGMGDEAGGSGGAVALSPRKSTRGTRRAAASPHTGREGRGRRWQPGRPAPDPATAGPPRFSRLLRGHRGRSSRRRAPSTAATPPPSSGRGAAGARAELGERRPSAGEGSSFHRWAEAEGEAGRRRTERGRVRRGSCSCS
jgi:hypothetical protein